MYDGALLVGGISIATIAITKFKCFVKKNGHLNYGCGCTDKPLIDDDEISVKQFELGDNVKGIYMMPKHVPHIKPEHHNETDSE